MSTILYNGPPEPPEGRSWCLVCLLLAKGRQMSTPGLDAFARDNRDERHWVEWPAEAELWPAEYRTMASVPGLGLAEVCWQHAAGITEGQASSLAVANGGLPPGLLKGRG